MVDGVMIGGAVNIYIKIREFIPGHIKFLDSFGTSLSV